MINHVTFRLKAHPAVLRTMIRSVFLMKTQVHVEHGLGLEDFHTFGHWTDIIVEFHWIAILSQHRIFLPNLLFGNLIT